MNTNLSVIEAFSAADRSVEECLIELSRYGNPRLSKMDSGWYAVVEVFVTGRGVQFDVKSGYKHESPKAALNLCFERLEAAFKKLGKTNMAGGAL